MIITHKKYYENLLKLDSEGRGKYFYKYVNNKELDEQAIVEMHKQNPIPVVEFYSLLSKKLHRIVKEVVENKPRPISECIKTATSIITQSTITLEKQFDSSMIEESNEFIKCVGLEDISEALYEFFKCGNSTKLQNEISRVREDILFIKKYNL